MTLPENAWRLHRGTPDLRSFGPLAAGPDGILFVADNVSASIVAMVPRYAEPEVIGPLDVADLEGGLAPLLGTEPADVAITDLLARDNPSVVVISARQRAGTRSVLAQVHSDGTITPLRIDDVAFAQLRLDDAASETDERTSPRVLQAGQGEITYTLADGREIAVVNDPYRTTTVTDMHYVEAGSLIVAGSSNEEFSATLRQFPFPFNDKVRANSLEIFHVSHGRFETASPIQSFVPFSSVPGDVLAAYTCTPIVRFSLHTSENRAHVVGTSVADLGPGSSPLDMISVRSGDDEYFLISNSSYPLMKITRTAIDIQPALVEKGEHVGASRVNLPHRNVSLMGVLRDEYVVMVQREESGRHALRSSGIGELGA